MGGGYCILGKRGSSTANGVMVAYGWGQTQARPRHVRYDILPLRIFHYRMACCRCSMVRAVCAVFSLPCVVFAFSCAVFALPSASMCLTVGGGRGHGQVTCCASPYLAGVYGTVWDTGLGRWVGWLGVEGRRVGGENRTRSKVEPFAQVRITEATVFVQGGVGKGGEGCRL